MLLGELSGELVQLGTLAHPFADVLHRADQSHHPALLELHPAERTHPQHRTVAASQLQLQIPAEAFGDAALHRCLDAVPMLGQEEADRLVERGLIARWHAVNPAGLLGPVEQRLPRIMQVDFPATDTRQLVGAVQQCLAAAQRFLLALDRVDVDVGAEHPLRLAVGRARDHPPALLHPDPAAVETAQPHLVDMSLAAAGEMAHQPAQRARALGRMGDLEAEAVIEPQRPRLARRQAENVPAALVQAQLAGLHIPLPGAGIRALDQMLQPLAGLDQLGLEALALPGREQHPGEALARRIGRVLRAPGTEQHRQTGAGGFAQHQLQLVHPLLMQQQRPDMGLQEDPAGRHQQQLEAPADPVGRLAADPGQQLGVELLQQTLAVGDQHRAGQRIQASRHDQVPISVPGGPRKSRIAAITSSGWLRCAQWPATSSTRSVLPASWRCR